jgi:hypothetical protein
MIHACVIIFVHQRLSTAPADRLDIVMRGRFSCVQLLTATFVVMLVIGCSSPAQGPDAEALALREMADEAMASSGIEDPVLRQISVNPSTGLHSFMVTDKDATVGVQLWADTPDQASSEWRIVPMEFVRHQADVSLDVGSINVDATIAMEAATEHWPGCVPRGQTVIGSTEGENQWVVFCDLPEGTVSGWVNAETGEFTPSKAPPAIAPVTATPAM